MEEIDIISTNFATDSDAIWIIWANILAVKTLLNSGSLRPSRDQVKEKAIFAANCRFNSYLMICFRAA